jgi:hypothetical protein
MADPVDIPVDYRNNAGVFVVTVTHYTGYTDDNDPMLVDIDIRNLATTWVDVITDTVDDGTVLFQTGHIGPGEEAREQRGLSNYEGKMIHIIRWSPDPIGIAGDGGGEVFFVMPSDGEVGISIEVHDAH